MPQKRFGLVVLTALILASCGGSEPKNAQEGASAAPPLPLSPAPTSRAELENKVGPLVELTATRKGEPGRYDRLGAERFNALNALSPTVALYIAATRKCDRLVDVDTRASSRDELVWRGRCENGTAFTVFEDDVRGVRAKLQGALSAATIAALPPPEPDDGNEPDELGWLTPCVDQFRSGLKEGETFLHDTWKLGRRKSDMRTLTVSGHISTNAFKERPARFACVGNVKTGKVVKIER